jgi:hypothetical protein
MSIMHKAMKMALMRTMRVPMPEMIRLQAVSVSTSAAPPQVRRRARAEEYRTKPPRE